MEANKKDLIGMLQPLLTRTKIPLKINLHILAERYPQGSEKQLIQAITGREVPSGKLPIDVRCLVFNVQTSLAIRQAVCQGMPLTDRVLTVAGLVEKPKNLAVRVGTPVSEILTYCRGELNPGRKLVIGGPMMGVQVPNAELPVLKGTSGILILPQEELPEEIAPCIRCGKCIEVCPMRLVPTEIGRNARLANWEGCRRFSVADCMECGCCSYICPARIPLVELFKWAKVEIKRKQ
jgi:electron transport complex protein RnfC